MSRTSLVIVLFLFAAGTHAETHSTLDSGRVVILSEGVRAVVDSACPSSQVHPGRNSIMNHPIKERFRKPRIEWNVNSLFCAQMEV